MKPKVIIAEKPAVARDIARVLNINDKKDGYFEGNGYQVTWAIGHLIQLPPPQVYNEKLSEGWKRENLPVIPDQFKLQTSPDAGLKKQFSIIKNLFNSAESIIVATDAGREGELIFRYIYYASGCNKPFERLWISSLTDDAIKDGFRNLKSGKQYDSLYYAAKSRSESDWLVGMNATMAITVSSGSQTAISLGRVQTPTLAMICKRYLDNKNFKPVPFFDLSILLDKAGIKFKAKHVKSFSQEQEANEAKTKVSSPAQCTKVDKKNKTEQAPLLFDLTSLQQEANKKFGFSAQKTLDIAQELYETHKLTTYPRTGSRYLSDDIYPTIQKLLKNVSIIARFKTVADQLLQEPISKRPFNNEKVTDHHAIIPTPISPDGKQLSKDVQSIYELIVVRFLSAFSKPCEKEVTTYEFTSGGLIFKSSGTVIKYAGWRGVETEEVQEDDQDENQSLPLVTQGENLTVLESKVDKKFTKPLPLYTEATLLKAMETAGKELDDEELKEAMKEGGLGTPATRAATIETLFKRDYIAREKKAIIATEKGLKVFDIVKDKPIASPELTGQWEFKLNKMAEGKASYSEFMTEIKAYAKSVTEELLNSSVSLRKDKVACFKCKNISMNDFPNKIQCEDQACGFVIWKEVGGKKLPEAAIEKLLKGEETDIIKGFKSKPKNGEKATSFDAYLYIKDDYKLAYKFNKESENNCPKCKKPLNASEKVISCSTQECGFKFWVEISQKKLSGKQINQLLKEGRTELIKGFTSAKTGNKFDAILKFAPDYSKVEFEFPNKK